MNSKELIKKIDIGRVGDGSVSYNDMCLILNKEETLEHLQYIEQLEKENQELKEKCKMLEENQEVVLTILETAVQEFEKENKELKNELKRCQDTIRKWTNNHSELIIDNGKMKKAWDILKKKIVSLEILNIGADLDTYHEILKVNPFYDKLTQEEFELLKEMLEEE